MNTRTRRCAIAGIFVSNVSAGNRHGRILNRWWGVREFKQNDIHIDFLRHGCSKLKTFTSLPSQFLVLGLLALRSRFISEPLAFDALQRAVGARGIINAERDAI